MAPRPRNRRSRDLPENLYEYGGHYKWRDPRSGKFFGLGNDRRKAIAQAMEANFAIRDETEVVRLVDRITGEGERTIRTFLPVYKEVLEKRRLAAKTLKERHQQLDVVASHFDEMVMTRITTLAISKFLDGYEAAGKGRMAQVYRSLLLDLFREAQAKGWIEANPVGVTKAAIVEIKRSRLTLPDFQTIYAKAESLEPWVRNSMALGLVTGQRREDVAAFRFTDVREGFLWVDQGKTGVKLRIPVSLRLDALGWSVEDVIRRCRDRVVSPYMVHNSRPHAKAKPGDPLHVSSLSAAFAKARDLAKVKGSDTQPPSFHELRSLAERLYSEQGIDTQTLLGHKDPRMTSTYHDARGAEWLEVKL